MKSKTEMGICFVLETFYPVVHGASSQVMLLGKRLVERGVQVTIIARKTDPEHPSRENLNGINIIRVKPSVGLKRIGKYLMIMPAFFSLIKERDRYDVIVVCDLKVLGILGVVAGKLLGKKCMLRAESCGEMNGAFAYQLSNQTYPFFKTMISGLTAMRNQLLKNADGFLSISTPITREFIESGVPENKINYIPNGIDISLFSPADPVRKKELRSKLNYSDKKIIFLYSGRITKGKGLEILLKAWKHLVRDFTSIHLILIGSGQGYSLDCTVDLQKFVKENQLVSSVTFAGNVENVNEYLQSADYYVLPSQTESFSISLVEALSCGLPCIATGVGGILDYMTHMDNGLLVPFGDEHKLYSAMEELLEDEDLCVRLGREGRKTVLEKFNMNNITDMYLHIFNS